MIRKGVTPILAAGAIGAVGLSALSLSPVAAATTCSSSFSVVASPSPDSGGDVLNGIAVLTSTDAWAVGDGTASSTTGNTTNTLFEHWDGTQWSAVTGAFTNGLTGPLGNTNGVLNAVAGSGANDVWAVGNAGLIEHWTGSAWSKVAAPSGTGNLTGVWADTTTDAWAVGGQGTTSASGVTEHWDGSAWSIVAGQDSAVSSWQSVSGSSASDVWAFGTGPNSPWLQAERWDGTSWTSKPPAPGNTGGPTADQAGGIADVAGTAFLSSSEPPIEGNSPGATTLEQWSGSTWSRVPGSTFPERTIMATSASAADDVWMGGLFHPPLNGIGGPPEPDVLHFDGSQVVDVPTVYPTSQGQFNGIAAIPGQEWAVGYSVDPSSHVDSTLIETACVAPPSGQVPDAPWTPGLVLLGVAGMAVAGARSSRRRRDITRGAGDAAS